RPAALSAALSANSGAVSRRGIDFMMRRLASLLAGGLLSDLARAKCASRFSPVDSAPPSPYKWGGRVVPHRTLRAAIGTGRGCSLQYHRQLVDIDSLSRGVGLRCRVRS